MTIISPSQRKTNHPVKVNKSQLFYLVHENKKKQQIICASVQEGKSHLSIQKICVAFFLVTVCCLPRFKQKNIAIQGDRLYIPDVS